MPCWFCLAGVGDERPLATSDGNKRTQHPGANQAQVVGGARPFVVGRAVFYRRPSIHGGTGLDYVLGGSGAVGWYVVELAPTVVADGVAEPLNTFACAQHPD